MANERAYQELLDRLGAFRDTVINQRAGDIALNPPLADEIGRLIDEIYESSVKTDMKSPGPPDKGLGQLAGIGPEAAEKLASTRIPQGIVPVRRECHFGADDRSRRSVLHLSA